ncbi:VirB10/TraB/TrbI family type IV secretion system protein [Citrobacter amalonaticus]|nr:TrbI/VirB10 family protein [Citrobacter amalonaticus]
MIDNAFPDEPEKTTAELESEARGRARSVMAGQEPEQKMPPGQPEVTRFRKTSSHRTLLVSLLSLVVLSLLALGGDRLLWALKNGDEKEADNAPSPSTGAAQHERKNLGMDSNPFGLFDPHRPDTAAGQTIAAAPPSLPEPSTLNKAAALADGVNSNASTTQRESHNGTEASSPTAPAAVSSIRGDNGNSGVAKVTGVKRLGLNPDLYIPVDRYIPCSMMRRFVSDVGGHISCLISEDVYSASNHVKLLPAGTIARGVYRTGALQQGRSRIFVLWTELRTPEPGSLQIPLTNTDATGQLGEAGISGWIDSHFWERFGNALMLSTVQDVAAAAADAAPGKDRNTDYTENTRAATAEMAKTTLENSINIPPTMYLNQGDVIGIMTGTDIDFSSVYQLRLKKRWYER